MSETRALRCPHCGCEAFNHRRALLDTALASFFGLDAFNQSADVYACRKCGRLEWFVPPDADYVVASTPRNESLRATECPTCNMVVKAGVARCVCGWTR